MNGNFIELNLPEFLAMFNMVDDLLLFETLSSFDLSDTKFPMSLVVPFTDFPFSAWRSNVYFTENPVLFLNYVIFPWEVSFNIYMLMTPNPTKTPSWISDSKSLNDFSTYFPALLQLNMFKSEFNIFTFINSKIYSSFSVL